ncbi:MAG: XRE family transcriptional regulator [Chloroflexota bacterium]|nr:XRE family transcriptional regulator [Chloroflexota bacterium]
MPVERMPITPEVLTWARERVGYKVDDLAAKSGFAEVAACERGQSKPTYRQLEKIAEILQLPVAIFFFPEPPDLPPIEETFRTLGSEQFAEIPPEIRLLLHKGRAFQLGLSELNDGRNPAARLITQDLKLRDDESLEDAAARIRDFVGVSLADQFGWKKEDTAFEAWRSAFYRVGVAVFKDAFGTDEFCGFSLYDTEFPVIYVNNSNAKTRQIFTLFHELAHLLHHTSGVDRHGYFEHDLAPDMAQIERRCNALANAILVPAAALEREVHAASQSRSEAEKLAKRFSVSREVIYRNFLDRGWIEQTEYEAAATEWTAQISKGQGTGGNYYRTKIRYLGEDYISLVLRRYYQGQFDEEDLANYLDTKPGNIDRLEEYFFGERG